MKPTSLWSYLGRSLLSCKVLSISLILTIIFDSLFDSFMPLGLSIMIDQGVAAKNSLIFSLFATILVAGWLVSLVSQLARDWLHAKLCARVLQNLRLELDTAIHKLDSGELRRLRSSDIQARFANDLSSIENLYLNVLPSLAFASLYLLLGIVVMAINDLRLALIVLIGLSLTIVGPLIFGRKALKVGQTLKEEEAEVLAQANDHFAAQSLIRTLGFGARFLQVFALKVQKLYLRSNTFYRLGNLTRRLPNLTIQFLHLSVLLFGAYLAFEGELGVGSLIAFSLLFANIQTAIIDIAQTSTVLIQARLAFERLYSWQSSNKHALSSDKSKAEQELEPKLQLPALQKQLRIEDICFDYPDLKVFDGLSFTIQARVRTAIVGPSGAGKSSLLRLLTRLNEPSSGHIWWEDTDLLANEASMVQGKIGVVFQENPVFNASLSYNIVLGDPHDHERLEWAVEAAGLSDWIADLPDGLQTIAGDAGSLLSGGQRQRLAIARAIYRKPDLLILDEASSALDPIAEAHFNQTLKQLAHECSIVHISHRLEGISDYEQIIVLDSGRVVAQGRHEELLADKQGLYSRMWRKQSGLVLDAWGERARVTAESLREYSLFETAKEETLRELASAFVSEKVEAGRTIIYQGMQGSRFCLVARGKVDVMMQTARSKIRLACLQEGDVFGEMSLLTAMPTSAEVIATGAVLILSLEKSTFFRILKNDKDLSELIYKLAESRRQENLHLKI